jgi:hypothetical protein
MPFLLETCVDTYALRERVRVRGLIRLFAIKSPHPNLLPGGEGADRHRAEAYY